MNQFKADGKLTEQSTTVEQARLVFTGTLQRDQQRLDYVETVTVRPDNTLGLAFDFTAVTDLTIRMWRHYVAFPVKRWAGATASVGGQSVTLPATLGGENLLPAAKEFSIEDRGLRLTVRSSLPLGLIDHRKYGAQEFLLAGYAANGAVKAGQKVRATLEVGLQRRP